MSWKEAGLGDNVLVDYTAAATNSSAVCAYINNGGKHPSAANKETVSGPVSKTGEFSSGKNGSITASLTVQPAGPGSFSCPSGQTLTLAFCSYSGISLTGTSNHVDATGLPDSVSRCNVTGSLAADLCP